MAGTGGFRPGAGRPRGRPRIQFIKPDPIPDLVQPMMQAEAKPIPNTKTRKKMSALEYAMSVFNDPDADPERRDRMALNALPYMHVKPSDEVKAKPKGKKEERQAIADEASTDGVFAVPAGPKIAINNG